MCAMVMSGADLPHSSCAIPCSGPPPIALILSQDKPLKPGFGAYLVSSKRGTKADLTIRGTKEFCLACQKSLLGRNPSLSIAVSLALMYEDNQTEVEMVKRHLHSDHINMIPQGGGLKDAQMINGHRIVVKSGDPLEDFGSDLADTLDAATFSSVGDVTSSTQGLFAISLTLRFSTNVTTKAHAGRNMFWRADVKVKHASGDGWVGQTDSPSFAYLAREPKGAINPQINEVISDGRPNELVLLQGSLLGTKQAGLMCRLCYPAGELGDVELAREESSEPSEFFKTRLPHDIQPGLALIYVFMPGMPGVESNAVCLEIRGPMDLPVLPQFVETPVKLAVTHIANPADTLMRVETLPADQPLAPSGRRSKGGRRALRKARADVPYRPRDEDPTINDVNRESSRDCLRQCAKVIRTASDEMELMFCSGLVS
eukprot:TRINITY_DN26943_c0_g3_i1.p1 TRINITY_DN26943_c0_g3~~TRINITY_DN26943_c0_g3_i1.p1  ORF type:complete len:428 (-),score=94.67 TRINITY_DN26943_c0_g3_i1:217-1500(-)